MEDKTMYVEVAYARPENQVILQVRVPVGSSIEQVIRISGILDRFPEIDLSAQKVGVFGRLRRPDDELQPGDRVEIYRALIADPKQVRKERAAKGKKTGKGAGRPD